MEATATPYAHRVAFAAELPQIAQLWLAMFEAVGKHRESDFAPDWRERFADYCAKRMQAGELRYFVVEDTGAIVACAGALIRDGYPMEIHGIRNGYIFGVSVQPEMRGRGLATALTGACVHWLTQTGVARISLHASPFGRPIYERMGFIPTNEMQLPKTV